jgi:hypothetical protein
MAIHPLRLRSEHASPACSLRIRHRIRSAKLPWLLSCAAPRPSWSATPSAAALSRTYPTWRCSPVENFRTGQCGRFSVVSDIAASRQCSTIRQRLRNCTLPAGRLWRRSWCLMPASPSALTLVVFDASGRLPTWPRSPDEANRSSAIGRCGCGSPNSLICRPTSRPMCCATASPQQTSRIGTSHWSQRSFKSGLPQAF